jgi:hypothetical protein
MKKGTKITVFIVSMGLTIGCLFAFVGPRHCGHHGMYKHGSCEQTSPGATHGDTNNSTN